MGRASRITQIARFCTLATLTTLGVFGGCGLATDGIPGVDRPQACERPEDCDDGNLCTVNNCGANKICAFTPTVGVDPPNQNPGDCKKVTCVDGKQVEEPDDADTEDGNSCTKGSCHNGVAAQDKVPDGTKCQLGTLPGSCTAGACVAPCSKDTDKCDDSNACTKDSCDVNAHHCVNEPLHGDLIDDSSDSDCVEIRCVMGAATRLPDDGGIRGDGLECTTDTCASTVAQHTPLPTGTACGAAMDQKCSPEGVCVGCNDAADCGGMSNDCQTITCESQRCGVDYATTGTPLPANQQTAGDCKQSQCGDMGMVIVVNDNSDLPPEDGNQCTNPTCTAGTPSYANVSNGTNCSTGKCLNGACVQCIADGDCGGGEKCFNNNCCKPDTCASLNLKCGTPSNGCGGTLACNDSTKNNSETDVDCGGPGCPLCAQSKTCSVNGDCASAHCADGVCCASPCIGTCRACKQALSGVPTGTCGNILAGLDDSSPVCTGTNTCNGMGMCVAMKANGDTCAMNADCASGHCPTPEKVCCNTACATSCASCKGSSTGLTNGVCGPVLSNTDPDNDCTTGTECCMGPGMCGGSGC